MKDKFTDLLRKVLFGSLASIAASNSSSGNTHFKVLESDLREGDTIFEPLLNRTSILGPKLILKKTSSDDWTIMSHRSHRSHSSHRSHYSSSSGGSSRSSTSSSRPSSSSSPSSHSNSISSGLSLTTANRVLGSRTLKKGMSGTDVTELINILLRKKYLNLNDGSTFVTGSYTYDETIKDAVEMFQSDNSITSDGICGSVTIYYLKNR